MICSSYEVVWFEDNELRCIAFMCEGRKDETPDEVEDFLTELKEKKLPYFLYFLGECEKLGEEEYTRLEANCSRFYYAVDGIIARRI